MNTQTYLRQIEKLDAVIKNKQERVDYLRSTLLGKGIDSSKERIKSSPQDRFSATVAEYIDEEKRISELLSVLLKRRNKIVEQMEQLETKHYKVLYCRYVNLMPFKEIMDEMSVSEKTVYRFHREALSEFEQKFGKEHNFDS